MQGLGAAGGTAGGARLGGRMGPAARRRWQQPGRARDSPCTAPGREPAAPVSSALQVARGTWEESGQPHLGARSLSPQEPGGTGGACIT